MRYRHLRLFTIGLALLLHCHLCLSQDAIPVRQPVPENGTAVEPPVPSVDWLLDLDIDSDNNDGLDPPNGSEWEDDIEAHEFSIGKLVETGAIRMTPVLIRLNTEAFKPSDGIEPSLDDVRVKLEFENAKGMVRLWSKPQPGAAAQKDAGEMLEPGKEYSLKELYFDAAAGEATIWIEAIEAAPGLDTKVAIDQNGRPEMFLRAILSGISKKELATDRVKYLPVAPGSFFTTFIAPDNRHLRNSLPAILINGPGGLMGTMKPAVPEQSKTYGFRLVTEGELTKILATSKLSVGHQRYITDVVYYKLRSSQDVSLDGVFGFRVGIYRDYNSGDYTLAFQYSLKDNITHLYQNVAPRYFEGRASEYINHRFVARLLSHFLALDEFAVDLPGLQLAGVGVGGDLAAFGALGSGAHADTYNTKPFPAEMAKQILTRYDPHQKKRIEPVPGSLDRFEHAEDFITGYQLEESPFGVVPGPFPIEPAP